MSSEQITRQSPHFLTLGVFILVLSGGSFLSLSVAKKSQPAISLSTSIPMWTRASGPAILSQKVNRKTLRNIKINGSMVKPISLWDAQYKKKMRYAAMPLATIIRKYRPSSKVNMALLHFRNKMIVPYPFHLMKDQKHFPIYLAFATWSSTNRVWEQRFPILSRSSKKLYRDVRPIRFSGNKIVMPKFWHPMHPNQSKTLLPPAKSFRPWKYADSLKSIEFVERASYYRQFRFVQTTEVKRGFRLYKQVCQFCHGVREVGAGFGWDFVEPYPIYRRRSGMSLFFHVKYRSSTAIAHGIMMPAIKGMKSSDAFALWYWMKTVAKKPLHPYQKVTPIKK